MTTPAAAGRAAGAAWRSAAPLLALAWALVRAGLALTALAVITAWRRRQAIAQAFISLCAVAYVAGLGAAYAVRRCARSRVLGPVEGLPAHQQRQALRAALLRFLAIRYRWRLA